MRKLLNEAREKEFNKAKFYLGPVKKLSYRPHQGAKEMARRNKQMLAGKLDFNASAKSKSWDKMKDANSPIGRQLADSAKSDLDISL